MSRSLFRGAVYRALYIRDFGQVSPAPAAIGVQGKDAAEAAATTPTNLLQSLATASSAPIRPTRAGACPGDGRDAGGRGAITRLGPALGGCVLAPKPSEIQSSSTARVLAEALQAGGRL